MKRSQFSILFTALASVALSVGAAAQVYPCTGNGAGCRDPIPDPSSEGYSAALTSTITVPAGVCSAANPLGSVGISFRILHDDIRDLGAIAVTSPTGVSIPLAPALSQGGEDYDYTTPCGTAVVSGSPYWDYFPAAPGTIVYSTAVSGASSASGTWTIQLLDTRHGAYGALDDWSLDVSCGIPGVTLTTVSATAIEGYGSPAVVTVSRSPVTAHPVRIYLTVAGTATSGADYAGVTFPIELCGGVASRDLSFAAILDALAEGSETVTLSLAASAGYAGAGTTAATLTLLDQVIPTFTTPAATTFTIGTVGTFGVAMVAVPAAVLTWAGTLPAGVGVTINGDGTATIAGTPDAGTAGVYPLTFTAARPIPPDVAQAFTLTIVKAPQAITFAQPADASFGSGPVALTATASSGLPVAFTSQTPAICSVAASTVTLLGVGTCTIAADQPGDDTWAAAPTVARSFGVGKTSQTIAFTQPPDVAFGSGPVALTATASSGLPVAFTSQTPAICSVAASTVTLLAVGTCTIAADQPGDDTWAAAPTVTRSFAVGLATNVITFAQPTDVVFGSGPVALVASASSGLPVAFTSDTPAVCSVSGSSVALLSAGTCSVGADQPGDATRAAAARVVRSFAILPMTTYTGPTATGSGMATVAFTGGGPGCTFVLASFEALPGTPPPGYAFPDGAFGFTVAGCTPGSTLAFTITHPAPVPPETVLWSYAGGTWSVIPAVVAGANVTFDVLVAPDGTAAGHVAAGAAIPPAIPTLSFWMMLLLAVVLAAAALRTMPPP